MSPVDIAAATLFALSWVLFEPLLPSLAGRQGALNDNMVVVRAAWMRALAARNMRIVDSQFLGHILNSASFFGSANLIVVTAACGLLLDEGAFRSVNGLAVVAPGPRWLFELKVAVIVVALARGLLEFIWSIRQLNYSLAAIGALPDEGPLELRRAWADAISLILNPALRSFSRGVRAYYFAMAAVAWLAGPWPFLLATLGAVALLAWRQSRSGAAQGVRRVRDLVAQGTDGPIGMSNSGKSCSGGRTAPPGEAGTQPAADDSLRDGRKSS